MSSAFASIVEVEERRLVRRSIAASILIYASLGGFVVAKGWLSTLGHASAEAPTLRSGTHHSSAGSAKLYETKVQQAQHVVIEKTVSTRPAASSQALTKSQALPEQQNQTVAGAPPQVLTRGPQVESAPAPKLPS